MARSLEEKREYFKKWYNLNKEKCLEKSRKQKTKTKRVPKEDKCLDCEKIKGIWAKGLCQACYSKMRRKTPEGILGLKKYNETKGKEAQKRYLEKQPKKETKYKINLVCECGKKAIAKGLCRNCYHKKRYVPKEEFLKKGRKPSDYSEIYLKILSKVKKGMSIQNACKCFGIMSTGGFYRNISDVQKTELRSYKSIGKIKKIDDY